MDNEKVEINGRTLVKKELKYAIKSCEKDMFHLDSVRQNLSILSWFCGLKEEEFKSLNICLDCMVYIITNYKNELIKIKDENNG